MIASPFWIGNVEQPFQVVQPQAGKLTLHCYMQVQSMKTKHFLVMMALLLAIGAVALFASNPLPVMLADEGDEPLHSAFLPIIFSTGAAGGQGTPTATRTPTPEVTVTPSETPTAEDMPTETPTSLACISGDGNVLSNGGFENEAADWVLHNDGRQDWQVGTPAYECQSSARVVLEKVGDNVQFNQSGFKLKNNTYYRITFAAYSNTGHDLKLFVHRNSAPYTNYETGGHEFNLSTVWQELSKEFLTTNIAGETVDTRLRFWFRGYAADGDSYWIDAVRLEEIGPGPTPVATATNTPTNTPEPGQTPTKTPRPRNTPTSTPEPGQTPTKTPKPGNTPTNTPEPDQTPTKTPKPGNTPTPTNTPGSGGGGGKELLVYQWNGKVTEANRGFPWRQPPKNNFDWTKPTNYAAGTLHFQVKINSQPVPQDMRLQFCFWQEKNGNKFGLENCGPLKSVRGEKGTTAEWSVKVNNMWKLNGKPIEWQRPRFRVAAVVKNKNGLPVSDFNGWKWNGEDPKKWYPIDWNFKVVVVAPGSSFSGWENYENE